MIVDTTMCLKDAFNAYFTDSQKFRGQQDHTASLLSIAKTSSARAGDLT